MSKKRKHSKLVEEEQGASKSSKPPQDETHSAVSKADLPLATGTISHAKPSKAKAIGFKWNFPTDYNDHFETPIQAYSDLLPVLQTLATQLGKTLSDLVIYDPYFCQGNMKAYLASLGVMRIINENKDFYKDIKNKTIPGKLHTYIHIFVRSHKHMWQNMMCW